jgi:hypothetical protein
MDRVVFCTYLDVDNEWCKIRFVVLFFAPAWCSDRHLLPVFFPVEHDSSTERTAENNDPDADLASTNAPETLEHKQ